MCINHAIITLLVKDWCTHKGTHREARPLRCAGDETPVLRAGDADNRSASNWDLFYHFSVDLCITIAFFGETATAAVDPGHTLPNPRRLR